MTTATTTTTDTADQAAELFARVVLHTVPAATLVPWTASVWAKQARAEGDHGHDHDQLIYWRTVAGSASVVAGVIAARFELVSHQQIEPATVELAPRPRTMVSSRTVGVPSERRSPVGHDGPPLRGDDFELLTWQWSPRHAHRSRWAVSLTGRLGVPEPVVPVTVPWPSGTTVTLL